MSSESKKIIIIASENKNKDLSGFIIVWIFCEKNISFLGKASQVNIKRIEIRIVTNGSIL